ncbi:guanine nucleotide exchange factor C9orf72 homolog isoform X1 [Hydractinia symbiolongicarpus]|uniref:guanine nucleotide exchange factor C9orf72 homolog isoform X1 n=1 Tax=Hydractinia symbiolongicarpus TaxID=13093 RepID=UPI00254CEFF8|nr:guanine nucleotide exchange factor C9orf72 homolog isoform X1 [Hydractinia symbiolongicarpus]
MANDGRMGSGESEFHINNLRPGRIKSSLFTAIMLAYWDNVMGPMITKVWKGNDKVEINEEIINYVSNHTLSGELCRQTEKNTIDPKLYVLSDLGYIFFAVIFNGHSKMGQTITSLSFIMAYTDLEKYLLLQDFINKQVKLAVLKYRILQRKDLGNAVKVFSSYMKSFAKTIDSLEHSNIPENICINNTVFGESEEANDSLLLDSKFLMKSITSHLQTCGCTIVIGRHPYKINLMIDTLALFLSPGERCCSRYANVEKKYVFNMDLYLQGIIDEPESVYMVISSKNILLNTFSVSLINVDEKTVQQTSPLNEHGIMRKDFLKSELGMLLHGSEAPIYPYHQLFTAEFGDISIMVQQFITELFAIPNKCSIRRKHVENFKLLLKHKSQTLLSYVEEKSDMGKEALSIHQIRQLKQDLSIHSDSDFRMILAAAEKIHPGIAVFMEGDDYIKEREIQAPSASLLWR